MTNIKQCKNCNSTLKEGDLFCASCGQKYRIGRPTLWSILSDFFSSIFNLDSEIYRSFLTIFKPGRLTNAFLNGRIKSFAPPIRVFVVSSIFFVAAFSTYTNTEEERRSSEQYIYKLHRSTFIDEIAAIKSKVYQHFPDTSTFHILDTLIYELTGGTRMPNNSFIIEKAQEGNIGLQTTKEVKTVDILTMSEDSLFKKYEIEGFFYQLLARQQIKNIKDGDSLQNYMIGRITILALIMMPVVALLLKLLYWRRKHYFIEHFIFSLHYHSFAFILLGILFLLSHLTSLDLVLFIPGSFVIMVYLFMAMKQVYQQSVGKTILKFILLNFSYIIVFSLFIINAFFISFLIF